MTSHDCLFVFPPGGHYKFGHFSYALGSGYVIAYLREKGVSALQFYCADSLTTGECAIKVLQHLPKIVGFTVFNTNFISCLLIAEHIKQHAPSTIIVFGGPTASNHAEFIVRHYPYVDICVSNEGEEVFYDLYRQLSSNSFKKQSARLREVKSITYIDRDGFCQTPAADILVNHAKTPHYLDRYPSPYLTGVIPAEEAATIGMITARGCNQSCTYCNCAVLSKRRFHMHSPERVVAEIDYIAGHLKPKQVLIIYDDAFTLVPPRAKAICRMIIDSKISVSLGCITRCDYTDEEMLDLMKESGFVSIGFSLESAVPRILRIIGKVRPAQDTPTDDMEKETRFVEKLEQVTTYAKKIGIPSVYSSIMVGLPTETVDEANRTIDVIDRLKGIDTYTHNFLSIYRGTPLYDKHRQYNYTIQQTAHVPVFGMTRYPTDIISKVRVSEKSQIYSNRKAFDGATAKILALLPQRTSATTHFDNVIILADRLTRTLVDWLKSSVAINATIIQIYSCKARYRRNVEENGKQLRRCYSPTLNVHNYTLAPKDGYDELISSYTMLLRDEGSDHNLIAGNTATLLPRCQGGDIRAGGTICHDATREDLYSLVGLLRGLRGMEDAFDYLASSRPLPYFSGLCRWSSSGANCETFETAIVDRKGNIRLCWTGEAVGHIGGVFADIVNRVDSLRRRVKQSRTCHTCDAEKRCIKCLHPAPFTCGEYCSRATSDKVGREADLLRTFSLLHDFLNL
jgi:radical SAM superfamily enzyme YgiQ (UPF0313 family)